ncbi:Protein-lysine N-methyltransferase rrg1 [Sphaceloma murrayae]|uniref:Protein-lysine N-methyltransferase rrg1 n=1 Tax=Sphaceloma murrayae TaxID=2082308 RepID=A0A2K1R2W8_9PEZI|nr:Protein-lysine N-methyltransferase rrg1 [Sphaceloma murrayae]
MITPASREPPARNLALDHLMERPLTEDHLGIEELELEPLSVHDLPQIHTKPSARALLETLALLSIESRSWEVTPPRTPGRGTPRSVSGTSTPARMPRRRVEAEGVPSYLTKIVSSHLAWIPDDTEKEKIWDTASVRLSERSGRTAMGAFTRTFPIPVLSNAVTTPNAHATDTSMEISLEDEMPHVEISIHEPALTADNLGFKTWATSYVLARTWATLLDTVAALKLCRCDETTKRELMLELGAGTGLVGIAAAAVLGVRILLTDLPLISSNLARNVTDNSHLIESAGADVSVAVLDWSEPGSVLHIAQDEVEDHQYPHAAAESGTNLNAMVIVAADPIYSMEHPVLLVKAIKQHLSKGIEARVIVGIPIREAYLEERTLFRREMVDIGLEMESEREDIGLDDWGSDEEPKEVVCSITIWKWADQ